MGHRPEAYKSGQRVAHQPCEKMAVEQGIQGFFRQLHDGDCYDKTAQNLQHLHPWAGFYEKCVTFSSRI